MKYEDLPKQQQLNFMYDLRRFKNENQWENKIITKLLRRMYKIELSPAELQRLIKLLGI